MTRDHVTYIRSNNGGVAKASQELEQKVKEELAVMPEPKPDKAKAAIEKNTGEDVKVHKLGDHKTDTVATKEDIDKVIKTLETN